MFADRKMLRLAFFISIVCHLAVLLSWRPWALSSEPPTRALDGKPAITAHLVPRLSERALPPALQMPVPSSSAEAMPSEVLAKPGHDPRHPVSGHFSPSTVTDDIAVTEKATARSVEPAVSPGVTSSPNEEISPDGVRQYRLNLAREARRFKYFPQLARDRGWEGVAVVVVSTVAGVPLPQVSLSQSSGFDLLDQEALLLVSQAVATAVMPDSLRSRPFALTLPIHYRLDD